MWEIDKTFHFEYGHRVHNQTLNSEYSIDGRCVCRHVHGHSGKIKVFLSGSELTRGMITDFKHLNWFKNFVDDYLDHKCIVDIDDPNIPLFVGASVERSTTGIVITLHEGAILAGIPVFVPGTEHLVGYQIDMTGVEEGDVKDHFDSFFFVDFVPTSENLAKHLCLAADAKMQKMGVKVSKLEWNETAKSRAVYINN